jgi:hypothetical protein
MKKFTTDETEFILRMLEENSNFLFVYGEEYYKDPLFFMRLGHAILRHKPIYILLPYGKFLPDGLKKVATCILSFNRDDESSIKEAVNKLSKMVWQNYDHDDIS